MLKITKNQIVPGQQVVISNMDKKTTSYSSLAMAQDSFRKAGYKDGDVLTITGAGGTSVEFVNSEGRKGSFWWSCFKALTDLVGENKGVDNDEYVIMYKGKRLNSKKFKDIGKVKASLLVAMDYHGLFEAESRKYLDNCPELKYLNVPYWIGGTTYTKEEFKDFEIFKWNNRKLSDKVTDFNPIDFYNEQMFYIKISSKFGSAARELFKKTTDEHKYMFVFMHEDYSLNNVYYEDLKESTIIKEVLSKLKLKGTFKATKLGKTAIAVKSSTDIVRIINSLPLDSKYLILDMNGDEMVKHENELFISHVREEKLNNILN